MADIEAWGEAGKKYDIHRETFSAFQKLKNMAVKAFEEMTPEEIRATSLRKSELLAGQVDFEGSEREIIVPCENGKGVPVSVYKPAHAKRVPAVWVYFHGGGLVSGSRNVYTTMLKTLARRAGCIVVSVEYRLAPENKAPAAFDDCRAVAQWVLANKTVVGGQESSQVGIGGDSAGGHLTASVSHDVHGLAFQILIYPQTDLTLSAPSYSEFVDTPGLNRNNITMFNGLFLVNQGQTTDPVLSPYHRPTFPSTLPAALCILAELDPLRDDGLAYCDKLNAAGVPTEVIMVRGAPHGFFHLPAHYKELTREPYEKCLQLISRFQSD